MAAINAGDGRTGQDSVNLLGSALMYASARIAGICEASGCMPEREALVEGYRACLTEGRIADGVIKAAMPLAVAGGLAGLYSGIGRGELPGDSWENPGCEQVEYGDWDAVEADAWRLEGELEERFGIDSAAGRLADELKEARYAYRMGRDGAGEELARLGRKAREMLGVCHVSSP